MISDAQRKRALDDIRENIARSGQHIYVVIGDTTPRFAYTIGANVALGFELVLAGAIFYMREEVGQIIRDAIAQLRASRDRELIEAAGLGSFTLRKVDSSWARELMLGVFDYYQKKDIPAFQIVPDRDHWTIDVPNMSVPWAATQEPVWRWLHEPWSYPVPEDSTATTNLAALRGERITEACRWEEGEWELFAGAGPDVPNEEMRVVSLGTLLAVDASLEPVVNLPIGTGLWRDATSDWHAWLKKDSDEGGRIPGV
ncbi:MAG TPA: DUF4262 domain-containing protein [Terriglobales bacterium]|nr:DUF4262 domain-containing protein [Terriglobales bacterium]